MTVGKLVPFIDNSYVSNKFIDIESAPNDEYLRGDGSWQTAATIVGTGLLLDTLGDVNLTTPADDDILTYDSASSKWINQSSLNLTDLILTGNLTVQGTTTTVDSTTMTVVDPIMTLQTVSGGGALTADTNKDVGLALQYHTGSAPKTAFVGLDDSEGKLTFIPDATITSEVVSGTKGTIVANLEGSADTVAGLTPSDGNFIVGDGSTWVAESAATARLSLGLGSIATHSLSSVLSMAAGSASAKYSSSTNKILKEGLGSIATRSLSSVLALMSTQVPSYLQYLDSASVSILKSGLGSIATHSLSSVLAMTQNQTSYDSKTEKILKGGLGTIASKDFATVMMAFDHRTSLKGLSDTVIDSATLADNDFLIFNASDSKWYNRNASTSRTKMGVAIGTDVQAHDVALDSLALVNSSTGNFIVGAGGGGWTAESGATARASLGLGSIATKSLAAVLAMTQGTGSATAAASTTSSETIYILLENGGGLGGQQLENEADTNNTNFILMPDTGDNYRSFDAFWGNLLVDADIGATVQAYDSTILKNANIGVTVQAYDSTILKSSDIGVTVQAYNANLLTSSDIGVTVQAYNANLLTSSDIGSTIQAYDAELAAIAGLTSAADKGIQFTGSGTAATYDLTTAGKALLDDADAAAQRTTLGLAIGSNVQAHDVALDSLAAVSSATGNFIVGAGGGGWQAESGATARTSLGLGSGDSPSFVTISATGTGSLKVPAGSTAQQGSPSQGGIRYNTDDSKFEGYDGSAWGALGGGGTAVPHQVSDATSSSADIQGNYQETMMIADTFNVIGTTTLLANFYLSKITDDGNPVTVTGSGTITGTGSMIARFPFAADTPKTNRSNLGLGHHGDGVATRSLSTAMLLTPTWGKAKQATDFVSAASGGSFGGNINTHNVLPVTNYDGVSGYTVGSSSFQYEAMWADTFNGNATSANWSDLAEKYKADYCYEEGTVLAIGGEQEVTIYMKGKPFAGVVSKKPGLILNAKLPDSEHFPYVCLKGRIPVKINGEAKKGDYIVADDNGKGKSIGKQWPDMHNLIGISLEDGVDIIEVKV